MKQACQGSEGKQRKLKPENRVPSSSGKSTSKVALKSHHPDILVSDRKLRFGSHSPQFLNSTKSLSSALTTSHCFLRLGPVPTAVQGKQQWSALQQPCSTCFHLIVRRQGTKVVEAQDTFYQLTPTHIRSPFPSGPNNKLSSPKLLCHACKPRVAHHCRN